MIDVRKYKDLLDYKSVDTNIISICDVKPLPVSIVDDITHITSTIETRLVKLDYKFTDFNNNYFEKFLIDNIIKNCKTDNIIKKLKNTLYVKDYDNLILWLVDQLLFECFYFRNSGICDKNTAILLNNKNLHRLYKYHHIIINNNGECYLKDSKLIINNYINDDTFILFNNKKINLFNKDNYFNIDYDKNSFKILNVDLSTLKDRRKNKLKNILY